MAHGSQYEIKETKEGSTVTSTMVKNQKYSDYKNAKILNNYNFF